MPTAAARLSLHAGGTIGECTARAPTRTACSSSRSPTAYPRTFGLAQSIAHALHVDEIDLLVRCEDAPLALPDDAPPSRRRQGDRPARRRLHPVRRDAADRHRLDPHPDRHAARRGRRRRLRAALGDVHRRLMACTSRQGHERGQGDLRRRQRRDVRVRFAGALRVAPTATTKSRFLPVESSTRRT